ncbi:MAG: dihydrolipoyl dehydrogenase family protein [Verrucomicrobiales bacterium]
MMKEYDFVVIGGGSAGFSGARAAVNAGLRTLVIEGAEPLGGLCILRGCMPGKALIACAERMMAIREAGEFGIQAGALHFDAKKIQARKKGLIGEFAEFRQEQLLDGQFDLLRGSAKLIGENEIEIVHATGQATERIRARTILVSTGSYVPKPPVPGLLEIGFWTSDEALDVEAIPASLIVLGAGAVALELAYFFRAFGTEVTVLQRGPRILSEADDDVALSLQSALERMGIRIITSVEVFQAGADGGHKKISYRLRDEPSKDLSVSAEEVLFAWGRWPATEGLGLHEIGVTLDKGRVLAKRTQQTSVPHIFSAGDVCGPYEVVHLAVQQGEVAGRNAARLLGKDSTPMEEVDYRLRCFGLFTHPEAAWVGMTEKDAEASGHAIKVGTHPFADHGKSMVLGATDGFVKIIRSEETGQVVGAACVGPEAVELIHVPLMAMNFQATPEDMLRCPLYHPTLSEIWSYPLENVL